MAFIHIKNPVCYEKKKRNTEDCLNKEHEIKALSPSFINLKMIYAVTLLILIWFFQFSALLF